MSKRWIVLSTLTCPRSRSCTTVSPIKHVLISSQSPPRSSICALGHACRPNFFTFRLKKRQTTRLRGSVLRYQNLSSIALVDRMRRLCLALISILSLQTYLVLALLSYCSSQCSSLDSFPSQGGATISQCRCTGWALVALCVE